MNSRMRDSRFVQQQLPSCQLIYTPKFVITTFMSLAVLLISIGIAILKASQSSDDCVHFIPRAEAISFITNPKSDKSCTVSLRVLKDMKAPIFIYYQLNNFYQNHRRYAMSKNDKQLHDAKFEDDTKDCDPQAITSDNKAIVPCGLIAWSLFNDTYTFASENEGLMDIDKKGIAWKSDVDAKFGSNVYPKNFQTGKLTGGGKLNEHSPLNQQEDLLVWMRVAPFSTFRKLYGKLNRDLKTGDRIKVTIENNYNTYSFGGEKRVVLSTTSWIGGRHYVIGIMYLVVGGVCLLLGVVYTTLHLMIKPREPNLSWERGILQPTSASQPSSPLSQRHLSSLGARGGEHSRMPAPSDEAVPPMPFEEPGPSRHKHSSLGDPGPSRRHLSYDEIVELD